MRLEDLRAEFPVLERVAYLNAGTDGPVPSRGADAAITRIRQEVESGRAGRTHFEGIQELAATLRARKAELMGCAAEAVALTHSTTDGLATAFAALPLGRGDEVLTSDEEHPGLLAPLEAARRRMGFSVRFAPLAELAQAVTSATKLVACSHVSWVNGRVVDTAALAASDALVVLDGAQGLGAVPVKVEELGCDVYAASGQKWLCGPDGTGSLYVRPELAETLDPPWPGYGSLADAQRPSELVVHPGARRFDLGISPGPATAWALAAHELLAEAGFDTVFERGAERAHALAAQLRERGLEVAERGRSTLVSWRSDDAEADTTRLAEQGVAVRYLPGQGLVRASIGAWSNDDDVERLVRGVAG